MTVYKQMVCFITKDSRYEICQDPSFITVFSFSPGYYSVDERKAQEKQKTPDTFHVKHFWGFL